MHQNSDPALKGRIGCVFRPFRPKPFVGVLTRGDALRFASRLPLAFISRAVGALSNFEAKLLVTRQMTHALMRRYSLYVDRDEIIRVLRTFEAAGLEYVLIGAAAMGFHGLVRATEDLDLFIKATPENIERLRSALRQAYNNDPQVDEISSSDLLGEYPAVSYFPPTGDLYFDVLTRLGEVASFETIDAEIKDVQGTTVRVATPLALYRMKKGTVREKDHVDAAALKERFDLKDE